MNGWLRDKMRAVLSGLNRDDGIGTEPLDDECDPSFEPVAEFEIKCPRCEEIENARKAEAAKRGARS